MALRVRDLLRQIAMEHELEILSGKVARDHVHAFLSYRPSQAISKEGVYLAKVEAYRTLRIPSIVGGRYPAHCGAAGKALLAFLSETEPEEVVRKRGLRRFTSQTITSPSAVKAELRRIAKRGYSIDNEEFEKGLKCIGAPVRQGPDGFSLPFTVSYYEIDGAYFS